MTVTVLIPSFQRPQMLSQCLQYVFAQTRQPQEIVVCIRRGDEATERVLNEWPFEHVKPAYSTSPGVVAAMNAGITSSIGDIVAMLDDDARPAPDWLDKIVGIFAANPSSLGVGGIDLQINPDHKNTSGRTLPVGTISWYGRLHGNHHLGTGRMRPATVLKGCNCAYRGDFLRKVGIDKCLRGSGAQVGWEISLGFDAMKEGGILFYDPAIRVNHLTAARMDGDTIHRGRYDQDSAYDIAWNYFSIIRRKAAPGLCFRLILWELAVGSANTPGVLRILDYRIGTPAERFRRIWQTFRALGNSRSQESIGVSTEQDSIATTVIHKVECADRGWE